MGHRDDRHVDAGQPADLGREHAAGVDDDVRPDLRRSPSCSTVTPVTRPRSTPIADDPRVRPDRDAPLAGTGREGQGQAGRVEPAVGRQVDGAEHAVERHQREERRAPRSALMSSTRQPERLGPAGLSAQLLQALRARRQPQRAHLVPRRVRAGLRGEAPVQLGAVHHHLRQRHGAAQLADEPRRVERGAGGQLGAVDEHDVGPAELGEVVRDRGAADAAADDDRPGVLDHPSSAPLPDPLRHR